MTFSECDSRLKSPNNWFNASNTFKRQVVAFLLFTRGLLPIPSCPRDGGGELLQSMGFRSVRFRNQYGPFGSLRKSDEIRAELIAIGIPLRLLQACPDTLRLSS
eukprot:g32426.t1